MNDSLRYSRLSNLAEVRAERERLLRQEAILRERMIQHGHRLNEVLSVDFWTGMLSRKIDQWLPSSQWIALGYETISSLFRCRYKRKARKKAKKQKNASKS